MLQRHLPICRFDLGIGCLPSGRSSWQARQVVSVGEGVYGFQDGFVGFEPELVERASLA